MNDNDDTVIKKDILVDVFDMLVSRLDTIESKLDTIKDHIIWKERHNHIKEEYMLNTALFGFPFDVTLYDDSNICNIFQYTNVMLKIPGLPNLFKTNLTNIQEFSKTVLTSQAFDQFWYDQDSPNRTTSELGIRNKTSLRYVEDYLLLAYMKHKLVHTDIDIDVIIQKPHTTYLIVRIKDQLQLYVDEIISRIGKAFPQIKSVTICPLANMYASLYDVIFSSYCTVDFATFSDILRERLTDLVVGEDSNIKRENISKYFMHKRFSGLVDTDELQYILRNI